MNENSNPEGTEGVKTIGTSITILEALQEMREANTTEIAEKTGLSKGAVYKHLITLVENEFIVREGNQYSLGFRFLDIGGELRFHYPAAAEIRLKVRELAEKSNEVGLFKIKEQNRTVTLFRENGSRGVFTRTRVGKRLYLHQTAGGKAILSTLPDDEVVDIIDSIGLPEATENTITDRETLFRELEETRKRGYAINRGESTPGVVGVAAPVVPEDVALGAFSVAGPRHRLDEAYIQEKILDPLQGIVNEVELNIVHSR